MCWRQWILHAYTLRPPDDFSCEPIFYPPTTRGAIADVEAALGARFRSELVAFLMETDGVMDRMRFSTAQGTNRVVDTGYLLWSVDKIRDENLSMRAWANEEDSGYFSLDGFLFCADSGCGDMFGYAITNGDIVSSDIYVWDHEDDSRTKVAPSLRTFIDSWLSGETRF